MGNKLLFENITVKLLLVATHMEELTEENVFLQVLFQFMFQVATMILSL